MKKDPRVYLAHILECAQKIERYTKGGEKEFHNDTMLQDAVIRNFEIIGEAAKRVPEAYCRANSQIPWRLMAGFRDVLIHAYEGVDLKRVGQIDLPGGQGSRLRSSCRRWKNWKKSWRSRKPTKRNLKNDGRIGKLAQVAI